MGKKNATAEVIKPEIEDVAFSKPDSPDTPDVPTVDDLEGVIPEPPEPDPLDNVSADELQARREILTRRIEQCTVECHGLRRRLALPGDGDDTGAIIQQAQMLEDEAVNLCHALGHLRGLEALKKCFDRERVCDECERRVVDLEAERGKAYRAAQEVTGRERKIADHRLRLIEEEIVEARARRDSEARNIPWRTRHSVESAIRQREKVLASLRRQKAKHEATLDSPGLRSIHDEARPALGRIEVEIEHETARIDGLRKEIENVPTRPHSDDPSTWPGEVLNRCSNPHEMTRVRERLEFARVIAS